MALIDINITTYREVVLLAINSHVLVSRRHATSVHRVEKRLVNLCVLVDNFTLARVVSDIGHHKAQREPPIWIGRIVGKQNGDPVRPKGASYFPPEPVE